MSDSGIQRPRAAARGSIRKLIGIVAVAWCFLSCDICFAQIQICLQAEHCKTFASPEDARRFVKARERDIILHMPIDYRDCILPALLDEMRPLRLKNIYVRRMDQKLAAKLAQHGIPALPESAFSKKLKELQSRSPHSAYYDFAFAFLATLKPNEEWEAGVGFYCGTLCLSRTRYVLRRVGSTCSIVSKKWEGGA